MVTLKNKSMEKEIPEAYYIIFQVWWRQLWHGHVMATRGTGPIVFIDNGTFD